MKLDDINKDFAKKSSNYASARELNNIIQQLELKANVNEVNEALASKASKDNVISALHRKANKAEIESILNTKVDIEDFQNLLNNVNQKIDLSDFEKLQVAVDNKADKSDFISISNSLSTKAEVKDIELLDVCYQELKRDTTKRIDDLDQDIDRLIENIKKEFQNLNIVVNNVDMKKADFKEFEKVNNLIGKKVDIEHLTSSLSQLKNDLYESLSLYKTDFQQNKKIFEDKLNEKIHLIEKSLEKTVDDFSRLKDRFGELYEVRKQDQDESMKHHKATLTNLAKDVSSDINLIRTEITKMKGEFEDAINRKSDKKELEFVKNKIYTDLGEKVNFSIITI